jgi:hypothetical protein
MQVVDQKLLAARTDAMARYHASVQAVNLVQPAFWRASLNTDPRAAEAADTPDAAHKM